MRSPTSNKVLTSRGRGPSDIFVAGMSMKDFLPINLNSYPFLFPTDKNMEWEDVQKITEKLSNTRKSNWDERTNRKELTQILSKEEERGGEYHYGIIQTQNPVYKLQLQSGLTSKDILQHCKILELSEPLLSWMKQRFGNLSDGFLWACEYDYECIANLLLCESEARGVNILAETSEGNTGLHLVCRKGRPEQVNIFLGNQFLVIFFIT